MSILVDDKSKVVVQGITGREGKVRTRLMKDYGTHVVGGVTPGKGGSEVYGIPVFDSVEEAWEKTGPVDISVVFVPAALVKDAALEADQNDLFRPDPTGGKGLADGFNRFSPRLDLDEKLSPMRHGIENFR